MTKQRIIGRVRFSAVDQVKAKESGSVIDRRIPHRKTQSFKGTEPFFSRNISPSIEGNIRSINVVSCREKEDAELVSETVFWENE